ncbi:conserved hypothetical protein [Gammaproteobacteria bacterium]
MASPAPSGTGSQITKTVLYGLAAAGLYALLYVFETQLLELIAQGRWHFLIPVCIAFVFSFFHGNFTAQFWDVIGIKAKN